MLRRMRRNTAAVILGGLLTATAIQANPVELGPDQLRAAAAEALRVHRPEQAAAYARALTTRDETDFTSHLILARALRDMGKSAEAKAAARRAWALADNKEKRYAGATVMAQVMSSAGHRTRAQLWLRRAVQAAPNDALSKKAIRDFKYLRTTNPWSTRLTFSVTPDSNINNGSSERSLFLDARFFETLTGGTGEWVFAGASRALSGIEYAFGLNTRYRFSETETRAHDITAGIDLRHYSLSEDAKEIAPDASGSDFSFISWRLGYGHRGFNFDKKGEYRLSVEGGQSWYSGNEYTRFVRLSAGQSYFTPGKTRFDTRLSFERQFGIRTSDQDTMRGDLSVGRRLEQGAHVSLTLTGAVAQSPSSDHTFDELGLRARVSLAKPVLGADLSLGLGVRVRDYDVSRYSADGRHDTRGSADVTFVFSEVDYYGFNPTMTISASQTNSNIGLYKSDRIGLNFGIQSAF